jgi:transposase
MQRAVVVTDVQWAKMLEFLRACPDVNVGAQWKCRRFLSAVLWMTRSGAQWRLLPAWYGKWNTVYKCFARWSEKNVFESFFAFCANDPDLESLMTDSTVVRAHARAAGAKKTRRPSVRPQLST